MDRTVNRFGDMLLDLCKASGMCIVNGRYNDDPNNGSYTYMTANGESVVDYLLTYFSHFKIICDFKVHAFNEYSNHTPLSFSIRTNRNNVREVTPNWKSVRWKECNKEIFMTRLSDNLVKIFAIVYLADSENSQVKVEGMVTSFTNFISSAANQLFVKNHVINNNVDFKQTFRQKKDKTVWYNDACKEKKTLVRAKITLYNQNKTSENRVALLKRKRIINISVESVGSSFKRKGVQK